MTEKIKHKNNNNNKKAICLSNELSLHKYWKSDTQKLKSVIKMS